MAKDFDGWNSMKKMIDTKPVSRRLYFHERDIWWCSLGLNIGVESDGKNEYFERPILIVKKFNADMVWALSITGTYHDDSDFYHRVIINGKYAHLCMSQIRTISTKRLLRRIGRIGSLEFCSILDVLRTFLNAKPPLKRGNLGARRH